jgi:hypothetical protein
MLSIYMKYMEKWFLFFCTGFIFILLITKKIKSPYLKYNVRKLFIVSFGLICVFGSISNYFENKSKKEKHSSDIKSDIKGFLKKAIVGVGSGFVFGVIDNVGLWYGMDILDEFFPKGKLTKAGWGNMYADTLSAFLATFTGNIISNITGIHDEIPLWANAFGTLLGCFCGLYGSKWLTGRN